MLGFNSSAVVAVTSNAYGAGAGRIILDGVSCTGTESSLLECRHSVLYSQECDHVDDVGVICKDETSTVSKPLAATTFKPRRVTKPTTNTTITKVPSSQRATAPKQDSSLPTTSTTTTTEKITKVTTTTTSRIGKATTVTTLTTTTSTSTTVTLQP
ncbi:integumentary mucin C.1-like isoform X3 [Pomacea canaliculata]|uniref:integumentary mucin C.1-like isoform X3 n=1 Tax=Pomacea canaliculata TaxID=400727 RepID=UPI000D73072D|nr:integumentary mucin C.1-like isoform X3 [Pomacea canaliculata]